MVERGEFIQGMGRAVAKETPRQMLGELEAERDAERAEEAEEAKQRQYVENDRQYCIEMAVERLDEDLNPRDRYTEKVELKDIVPIVRRNANELGWNPDVVGPIGRDALLFALYFPTGDRADFFDLREQLRTVNSVAALCHVESLEPILARVDSSVIGPVDLLREALAYPAAAFARQHARNPNGPERHGYDIVSDLDVDTLAGHVSHVGILRAAVADLSLERQRAVIRELMETLLPKDAEGRMFFPRDSDLLDLQVIRKAFPFAKAEILARAKGDYNGTFALDPLFKEQELRSVLGSIERARAFSEACGIPTDWKDGARDFLRRLNMEPTNGFAWETDVDEFESKMRMIQAIVGALWEDLPKSILAECPYMRAAIYHSSGQTTISDRLAAFARATGVTWVPGTPWPSREDVRVLYDDIFAFAQRAFNAREWKGVDELEAATGFDRWSFVTERQRSFLRNTRLFGDVVPASREEAGALFRARLLTGEPVGIGTILFMRGVLGSDVFDALPPDHPNTRNLVFRLLGMGPTSNSYDGHDEDSALILGGELWPHAASSPDAIRDAIALNEGFIFRAVDANGTAVPELVPVVRAVIAACRVETLSTEGYIRLATFARTDGTKLAPPSGEQLLMAVRHSLLGELIPFVELPVLSQILKDVPWDSIEAYHLRTLAADHRAELQAVWNLDRAGHEGGIVGLVLRLCQAQPPVKNARHNPWQSELPNLLRAIRYHDPASVDGLVSFVETFGMIGTERLCKLYVGMYRAKTFEEIEEGERYDYESDLGSIGMVLSEEPSPKIRPAATPRGVCQELRKFVAAIPQRLMNGESIPGLDETLGREMFAALLGETQWKQSDSVSELQRMLNEDVRIHPERAGVPAAFRQTELAVREARHVDETGEEGRKARIEKFLASREVEERFGALAASWNIGLHGPLDEAQLAEKRAEVVVELTGMADALDATLSFDDATYSELLKRADSDVERTSLIRRREAARTERGKAGLARQSERVRWLAGDLAGQELLSSHDLVEWLAAHGSDLPSTPERLRELTAREMSAIMPAGMVGALMVATISDPSQMTLGLLEDVATVQRQYVREHYLNPGQKPEHTGHPPFSRTTLRALEKAWHLVETRNRMLPIEETLAKGKRIESPLGEASDETVAVRMIPVAGLLRVYAGEIGDACYSSRHAQLASGEYPKLNAWIYATVDDKDRMTLRGSALALGLRSTAGDRVLVLRANNPKENFVRGLDAASFVPATLREAIATARREWEDADPEERKWPRVVAFPLDRASMSSTNRPTVAAEYSRRFSDNPRLQLNRSAEATFNGYDLTQPYGRSPCVEVWRIDADGQETWTGNWE